MSDEEVIEVTVDINELKKLKVDNRYGCSQNLASRMLD